MKPKTRTGMCYFCGDTVTTGIDGRTTWPPRSTNKEMTAGNRVFAHWTCEANMWRSEYAAVLEQARGDRNKAITLLRLREPKESGPTYEDLAGAVGLSPERIAQIVKRERGKL
jgi:hypothetical protein